MTCLAHLKMKQQTGLYSTEHHKNCQSQKKLKSGRSLKLRWRRLCTALKQVFLTSLMDDFAHCAELYGMNRKNIAYFLGQCGHESQRTPIPGRDCRWVGVRRTTRPGKHLSRGWCEIRWHGQDSGDGFVTTTRSLVITCKEG